MKAQVKAILSPDVDLESPESQGTGLSNVLIQFLVGPANEPGEESFDVLVCTTNWLANRVTDKGPQFGRGMLIVDRIDLPEAIRVISSRLEQAEAETWASVAAKLSLVGFWEFDDYRA